MAFDIKKFKVSADMLKHSADDFKAIMKRQRPKMKVRDINALYKSLHGYDMSIKEKEEIHGNDSSIPKEAIKDSE